MNSEPKMIPVETPVPITWLDISWNARVRMTNDPALRDQMTNGRLRVPNSRQKYSARTRTQLSTFKVRRLWSRGPVVPLVRFSPSRPVVRVPWSRGFSPGFTLIELLVVIAIIAILAALLLPAIAHARIHAQKTQAKTDVQSIVNAVHKYESEYNRMPIAREVLGYAVANNEDY